MATPVASLWCVFVRQLLSGATIVPLMVVFSVYPLVSLVAALGKIAPYFIVFLGELLCLPMV
jgi:hypothetical protein